MPGQIVRVIVRPLAGPVLGAAAGALYTGLVGAVHLGVYGHWVTVPTFAGGCVLAGSVLGLLLAAVVPAGDANAERDGGALGAAGRRPRNEARPACSSLIRSLLPVPLFRQEAGEDHAGALSGAVEGTGRFSASQVKWLPAQRITGLSGRLRRRDGAEGGSGSHQSAPPARFLPYPSTER